MKFLKKIKIISFKKTNKSVFKIEEKTAIKQTKK